MAIVRVSIDIGGGAREIAIDPDELSMGFFEDIEEAQETGKWRPIMRAYGELLGFTREEVRAMKAPQFMETIRAVTSAMQQATAVPNDGGPPSG
jgi:hypothetical protein